MISTIIIEDERMLSDLLSDYFAKDEGYEVLETFSDGLEAIKACKELKPELILSDIRLPSLNGIEILKRIKSDKEDTKFILLSAHYTKSCIQQALQAGVDGMIEKTATLHEMVEAIDKVMNNELFYGKDVLTLMRESMMNPKANNPLEIMTDREREVVQLIAEGYSTREISGKLEIGIKTCETHRLRVTQKLGFRGVADITRFAIEHGLISYNKKE